jgi:PIN domain nuclease of toxin-antitoxin system
VHAQRAGRLAGEHRDPFDRMLAAQAQLEDLPLVTDDPVFDGLGVNRIW